MKILMIGMDGGHLDAYKRGWTPYLENLIEQADVADINEDLLGRGWTKIITGEVSSITGALYDRAALDGTHSWSKNFKLADIPNIGTQIKPIWQRLCERGYKVGIMNVPTAFPAAEVNGFFVSGGGGGGPVLQDPTEELCYPREIHPYLLDMGYIVDERMGSMVVEKKIYDASDFFQRYAFKNSKRTQAFIELSAKYDIDFGLVVYKTSSNIAEFYLLPELLEAKISGRKETSDLTEAIKAYYEAFDNEIRRLKEANPSAEIIFVSDHGMAAREWSFNPNKLLQEIGLQKGSKSNRGIWEFIRIAKKLIPFSLRTAIRNTKAIKKAYESHVNFDIKETKAFSMVLGDWNHGIFVNDQTRFGGPVNPADIETVKVEIVERISANPEAQKHGITASLRANPDKSPHFPDVVLSIPDGYIDSSDYNQSFKKFSSPKGPHTIKTLTQGQLLCGKSSKALAVSYGGKWQNTHANDDLTITYHHVLSRLPDLS